MKRILILPGVLLVLSFPTVGRSQYSGSEQFGQFGSFGQLNPQVTYVNPLPNNVAVNENGCAPTAIANGLAYMNNYLSSISQPSPFAFSPTYTSVNNLAAAMQTVNYKAYYYLDGGGALKYTSYYAPDDAAGTAAGGITRTLGFVGGTGLFNMYNGLRNYLGPTGVNPSPLVLVGGQIAAGTPAGWSANQGAFSAGIAHATPTAQVLASLLNSHNAVELSLEWGTLNGNTWTTHNGGHQVTLTSITLNNDNTGTISFIDPQATATIGDLVDATLTLKPDGYLYVTDQIDHFGQFGISDPDDNLFANPADATLGASASTGRIDADIYEYLVPEPSTYALAALAAMAWLGMKRLRSCAAQ